MTTRWWGRRLAASWWVSVVIAVVACGGPTPGTASGSGVRPTAAEACRTTAGNGPWSLGVEIDRADSATLALISGPDIALCETSRSTEGFGAATSVGIGRHPIAAPPILTYSSSSETPGGSPRALVGRVPPSAVAVRLGFADGSDRLASVANGIWLAWLDDPAIPTRIEAIDGAGAILGRITDPDGIQPGG